MLIRSCAELTLDDDIPDHSRESIRDITNQVDRLESERASDQARGETQTISTSITALAIEERDPNRIAATVALRYADQRLNAKGDPEGNPTKLELRNRYVFARDGGLWRLVSFQKAP